MMVCSATPKRRRHFTASWHAAARSRSTAASETGGRSRRCCGCFGLRCASLIVDYLVGVGGCRRAGAASALWAGRARAASPNGPASAAGASAVWGMLAAGVGKSAAVPPVPFPPPLLLLLAVVAGVLCQRRVKAWVFIVVSMLPVW